MTIPGGLGNVEIIENIPGTPPGSVGIYWPDYGDFVFVVPDPEDKDNPIIIHDPPPPSSGIADGTPDEEDENGAVPTGFHCIISRLLDTSTTLMAPVFPGFPQGFSGFTLIPGHF